ncbi:protein odr-4 homolog [Culicoides brevitarsis]|uniref:protein odr-4 homolog n=1 Tax=Culicoides brevitarsis TaxID=469753 RepID=UPI00307BE265
MGRQVIADVSLETYLKSLCKMQEIITGLIIGQPSKTSKDNVVHFARTPTEGTKIDSLSQVDVSAFANHVADTLKMLPGGMFILGVFVVGPKDVFSDNAGVQKLKSLIVNLQHTIKGNKVLLGDSDSFDDGEKLVLWYSSSNNSFACKNFSGDSTKGAQLKGVDFKFQPKLAQNWVTFETFYKLNEHLAIEDVENASNEDVLMLPLKYLSGALDKSKVFFNGAPYDASETVEKVTNDSRTVQAQVFKICDPVETENLESKSVEKADHTIMAQGFLSSRTFLPLKATLAEAEAFIKQDILRTLAARIQILADSLVDTKVTVGEVVINEPPRRIYFPIAAKDSLLFSDYLFPNETIDTISQQIKQNLDVTLKPDQIQLNVEVVCDNQTSQKEHKSKDDKSAKGHQQAASGKIYFIMIIVAVLVLILSIIAHFYLN